MQLISGQRMLFVGDSITAAGRNDMEPLGHGYVAMTRALLTVSCPRLSVDMINRGVAGDTVRDLSERWSRDVLAQQPDWLVVLVGINDVWETHAVTASPRAISVSEYDAAYRALLDTLRQNRMCQVILIEPFVVEVSSVDAIREHVEAYAARAREIAVDVGARYVAAQDLFDKLSRASSPPLSEDRVHPTARGHAVLALAVLESIGWSDP